MRITGLELPIARLTIHERGFMNRFKFVDTIQAKFTAEKPITLESVEFNEKYDLTIDDNADDIWIRRIFDPATIAAAPRARSHSRTCKYYDSAWWFVEKEHLDAKRARQAGHLERRSRAGDRAPGTGPESLAANRTALAALLDERHRVAAETRAAGTADAVDVVVVGLRLIEVDDVGDLRDVEATCGDVGRDEDVDLVGLERVERALALRL